MLRRLPLLVSVLFLPLFLLAKGSEKRALAEEDYDGWRSIASSVLSRDGGWLGYSFMPQVGDGEIVLRALKTGREQRVPVGALPPAPLTASEENPERPTPRREVSIFFTSDARFAVATLFPQHAEMLEAKRAKKNADDLPKEGLVVVNLASGETTRIAGVKNFQVPARGSSWLAYLKEPVPAKPPEKVLASAVPTKPTPVKKTREKKIGSELVLRDLAAGTVRSFPNVIEYSLARDGRTLLFTVSSRMETENGVFAITPGKNETPLALARGPGRYQKLAWDRAQTQAAFVTDRADPQARTPRFALYTWTRGTAAAVEIVSASTAGVPAGHAVSGDATTAFSFDGRKVYVSTAPVLPPADERLETQLDEDKVTADLWRWNDDYIQPVQKIRADRERKRSYLGVFDRVTKRFTQLGDTTLSVITMNDDGSRGLGYDDRPYRLRFDYDAAYQDAYLVSAETAQRELVARQLGERAGMRWSPNNRWLAYFDAGQWYAIDASNRRVIPLTEILPVAFQDELADMPEAPPSYGMAGWTSDGDSVLLYDRYDVWQVFPDGRAAKNLTAGHGRAEKIQLRRQVIDPEEPEDEVRGIDPSQPLYLRGESETTRATGFFRTGFTATAQPERLLWADKNFRFVSRAHDADVLLLSASRFDEFPDLYTTTTAFAAPKKVSDGDAQRAPFLWGSAELVSYRTAEGTELSATLYKPANFDPGKKYPMIVYFYERLSQIVHNFFPPTPGTTINPSYYTSNGYLVLLPDIAYKTGYPGQSALNCIVAATDEIVRRGFVDENAIGLQGHSWGGYQIAYMVTQTHRFRAAEAGAVVGNMTSAYSGIRWGSGRARQFQYEKTQSRLGKTLQEAPQLYIENSPVFMADRVQTPLLLLHNDHDDAVPWEQGIEFFLALRRHGKEAYLFNYNNEFHGLRRRADQKDFAKRMSQFFDHFLKGAPRPDWMENGIPYLDRDAEKLQFNAAP